MAFPSQKAPKQRLVNELKKPANGHWTWPTSVFMYQGAPVAKV